MRENGGMEVDRGYEIQKRQGNREKNRGTKVGNRVEWERVSGHKDSSEEGVGYIKGAVQSAS